MRMDFMNRCLTLNADRIMESDALCEVPMGKFGRPVILELECESTLAVYCRK